MQEIKEKVYALTELYRDSLASKGIKISVSKRYFELDPRNRNILHPNPGIRIANLIQRRFDSKREARSGYNNRPNSYHCIILRFSPKEMIANKDEAGIDYAFVLQKTERAHKGIAPEKTVYNEKRTLKRIEKRILKILKEAEISTPDRLCKETVADAFRYVLSFKYSYKKKILNKDPVFWEIASLFAFAAIIFIVVLIVWGIRNLL